MNRPIIAAEEFIEQAIEALGGRDSLYNIFSLHIQLERCIWMVDSEPAIMRIDIYRAQGGRIRQEEFTSETARTVTILNGLSGIRRQEKLKNEQFQLEEERELDAVEVEQIKRNVRLYPRNFLAHADEHQFKFSGLQQVDNQQVYALDLLVEDVSYHFDSTTLQCLRMIDRRNDSITSYEDYQQINGILTPMNERTTQAGRNFRVDSIKSITYNISFEEDLFQVI